LLYPTRWQAGCRMDRNPQTEWRECWGNTTRGLGYFKPKPRRVVRSSIVVVVPLPPCLFDLDLEVWRVDFMQLSSL
jgi:hypothetical protein